VKNQYDIRLEKQGSSFRVGAASSGERELLTFLFAIYALLKSMFSTSAQGNIQVQFYAATNWDRDVKAVILLGAFGNLPWKSRNILVQDEDRFRALIDASMKALRDSTPNQVLPVKMRFSNPVSPAAQEAPITGQHFLTYRWERTSVADGTYWIHRIPDPILIVRDQSDGARLHPSNHTCC
jgi:hypothetical protein